MMGLRRRVASLGVGCIVALVAGGCGGFDGIDVNGKIFDALGVSTAALNAPKPEPKVAQRGPLVIPPDTQKLPEPGSSPPPVLNAEQNWPVDAEQKKVADAADAKRKQDEYCRDGNWKEKAMDRESSGGQGPLGYCNNSIFGALSKTLFGNQE
jgi:hypothetical protein